MIDDNGSVSKIIDLFKLLAEYVYIKKFIYYFIDQTLDICQR